MAWGYPGYISVISIAICEAAVPMLSLSCGASICDFHGLFPFISAVLISSKFCGLSTHAHFFYHLKKVLNSYQYYIYWTEACDSYKKSVHLGLSFYLEWVQCHKAYSNLQ
jgi:hypothetical protein